MSVCTVSQSIIPSSSIILRSHTRRIPAITMKSRVFAVPRWNPPAFFKSTSGVSMNSDHSLVHDPQFPASLRVFSTSDEKRHEDYGSHQTSNIDEEQTSETTERRTLDPNNDVIVYPKGLSLALTLLGVCLSVFIVPLDRSIVTTTIPAITAEFGSTDDIGWYESAYLLLHQPFNHSTDESIPPLALKALFSLLLLYLLWEPYCAACHLTRSLLLSVAPSKE